MKKREVSWLSGTAGLAGIFSVLLFGIDGFRANSTLDINIHDTYFVFANVHLTILILVLTLFLVYLIRAINQNFKNLTANLILIVSTILLIIFFTGLNSIIDSILLQHSGWTIYPPLSTEVESPEIEEEIGQIENIFEIFSKITLATQILLLILLAFCGFKTGLNYKSKQ